MSTTPENNTNAQSINKTEKFGVLEEPLCQTAEELYRSQNIYPRQKFGQPGLSKYDMWSFDVDGRDIEFCVEPKFPREKDFIIREIFGKDVDVASIMINEYKLAFLSPDLIVASYKLRERNVFTEQETMYLTQRIDEFADGYADPQRLLEAEQAVNEIWTEDVKSEYRFSELTALVGAIRHKLVDLT